MRRFACILAAFALSSLIGCGGSTPEEKLVKARAYIADDDLRSATIELKNALQQDGNMAEARFVLGKLYFDQDDMVSAEKELQRARSLGYPEEDIFPMLAQALLEMESFEELAGLSFANLSPDAAATVQAAQGLAALSGGDIDTADAMIGQALDSNPDSTYAGVASARVQAVRGDLRGARETLERVLGKEVGYAAAWNLLGDVERYAGNAEAADAAYSSAIESASLPFNQQIKRATLRVEEMDLDGAQEDINALMKIAPKHPGVAYTQGLVHYYRQQMSEAIEAFTIAEQAEDLYPRALFYLATANYRLGNVEQAKAYAERFYSIQPMNLAGRKLLATLLLAEGDYKSVVELMVPVVQLAPEDVGSLNVMANALLGLQRVDEGIELLARVVELQPDSPVAQVRFGAGLLMGGDQALGVERLETAVELNPELQQADILLVLNYMRGGQAEKAIEAAQALADRQPESVTPQNLLGRIYREIGDREKAVAAFKSALDIDAQDPSANFALGIMAEQEGKPEQARTYYETALKRDASLVAPQIRLAVLDYDAGDQAAMVKRLEQAILANPGAIQPRVLLARQMLAEGKPERVALLFSNLSESARRTPAVLREMAKAHLVQEKYILAEDLLKQELEVNSQDDQVYFLLASSLARRGEAERAQQQFEAALTLNPEHFGALLARARYFLAQGDLKAMQPYLERLVKQAPDTSAVLNLRADAEKAMGNTGEALALLKKNLELNPGTRSLLLLSRQLFEQGKATEALSLMEGWIQQHPEDMAARTDLAMRYSEHGREPEAVNEYRVVLAANPDNVLVLNNLAWQLREDEPEEAVKYAEQAVQLAPESADVLDTLAMIQLHNGQVRNATRSIQRAMQKDPGNLSLQFHSAQIALQAGETDAAKKTLESVVSSGVEFPEMAEARELLEQM